MKYLRLAGIVSLLMLQSAAFAYDYSYQKDNEDKLGKFYVGTGAGYMLGDAFSLCQDNDDLSCIFWKAFGGYHPTESIAVEASYHNLMSGRTDKGTKLDSTALSLSVLQFMPLQEGIEGFGKIGFAAWDTHSQGEETGSDGTDILLGAGAQMKLKENINVRGEVEYIGGDLNSTNITAGITYSTH